MPNTSRDLDFTQEEWSIILSLSSSQTAMVSRIGWYASVLCPIVLFCAYGSLRREITAVEMAFICLLGCVLWSILSELRSAQVYRSICSKVVAFKDSEKASSASDTSS